jgi:alkanesulfonate monooxygenase SsuD/methylene tetrahydromethanopterin reductase-like flavin-dependent oxidoreductase (luciferase family)
LKNCCIAERGKFDLLFLGDSANTSENHGGTHHAAVRYGMRWPKHDMSPLIRLMARAAAGIGFGLTMSTTYQHPFHVARFFNSLNHAREHMEVACALWNSVDKDAIVFDKTSGVFADPEKVRLINHTGKYFNVRRTLPVIPSLQHRPVLIQAGQSPAGSISRPPSRDAVRRA